MSLCRSGVALTRAERVALCVLHRALRGEAESCTSLVCPFGVGRDERELSELFAATWSEDPIPAALRGFTVWRITKTERRLLRALAAAQVENTALLERYLCFFIARARPRHRMAMAMEALAAILAVHGYWLPQPDDSFPIPAAVLMLARAQGRDLEMVNIAWPGQTMPKVTVSG